MTQKEKENLNSTIKEKLPDIYTSKQSIKQRNQVIDEYIKSLDQTGSKQNGVSLTSDDEDDKDPFSSKAMKYLKKIKKEKNKLILPNFKKRELLKNESPSRNNNNNGNNLPQDSFNNKKMPKKKNFSDNNIIQKNENNAYTGMLMNINGINNDLNSKWTTSSSTYNNYIYFSKNNPKNTNCNLFKPNNVNNNKLKTNNININNNNIINEYNNNPKRRSKSHIGKNDSYKLYKNKLNPNPLLNNSNFNSNNNKKVNIINKKYAFTQININPYSYFNSGKNNLYNNIYKMEQKKRRNFTAKMIKSKISIKDKKKNWNKNYRINSTLNTQRIMENRHQIYEKLIKEKNNPYGLGWINKILKNNKIEKVMLSKEFINGVPIIKLLGKANISKRELKKRLGEIEKKKKEEENKYNNIINAKAKLNENKLDDEYNIPNEILEQFNRNTKNFFKVRKDIIEIPDEEEQGNDK